MELNIYNISFLYYISLAHSNKLKIPNRIEIIRDFENFINIKYINYNLNNKILNRVKLSNDNLFFYLQKVIFNKIDNYSNLDDLKIKLTDDISYKLSKDMNIYDIANIWCTKKYGLI